VYITATKVISGEVSSAQLAPLLRGPERPVFIISTLHSTSQDARRDKEKIDAISEATGGKFVIALEYTNIDKYVKYFATVAGMDKETMLLETSKIAVASAFPDYTFSAFRSYVPIVALGTKVRLIDFSTYDPEGRDAREIELRRPMAPPNIDTANISELIPYFSAIIKIGQAQDSLRNAVYTRNLRNALVETDLPLVVVVGSMHVQYLAQHLPSGNMVLLEEPENVSFLKLADSAYAAAARNAQSNEDLLAIGKHIAYSRLSSYKYTGESLDSVIRAQSMEELVPLWDAAKEKAMRR
jgi:hypothetical protein